MKAHKFLSPKKVIETRLDITVVSKNLSGKQKEVIRLLKKKEVLIINDNKKVFITCGKTEKKVSFHSFYNLVNKGLLHRDQVPSNYVLSATGKKIIIS